MKEWKTLRGRCVLGVCGWGKLRVFWLWIPFWLLNTSTTLFGLPKRCTVAELLHIASDSDNDSVHIGIILLCEVLASSLLNMHERLKWILEDPTPHHPYPPPAPSPSLSNYIIIFLSIKIQMHNLNIWQQQAEREAFCSAAGSKVAFDERRMLNWHCCGKKKKAKENNKRKNNPPKFSPMWNLTALLQKCDTETYWQIWNIQQGYSEAAPGGSTALRRQAPVNLWLFHTVIFKLITLSVW